MKKKLEIVFTLLLFGVLVYTRLTIRALNPLWIDEINEISHLRSLSYLIYEYLPTIPGGVLSHYFLMLPLNIFFPGNKFILSFPGFISSLLVFLLIPTAISSLDIANRQEIKIASLIARIGFVFDPRLTFQAMEIRPYSLLPLLWILLVILVKKIISYGEDSKALKIKDIFLLSMTAVFLWLWHIYGFMMFILIYLFFIFRSKLSKSIFNKHYKSFIVVYISLLIFIPIWIHFTRSSTNSNLDTFEFVRNFDKIGDAILNKGYIKGILWQNYFYLFILFSFFILVICGVFLKISRYISQFLKMLLFFVILPVLVIFLLDLIGEYWFLYRQFAWVALPFYAAIGILVSSFRLKLLQ